MPIIVFEVIALIFQRIERFIFTLPSGSAASHEVIDVARAHPQVRHPTEVLDAVSPHFPVLDEIDTYGRVRLIERHVIDNTKTMNQNGSAVVSLVRGHAPAVLRGLDLL